MDLLTGVGRASDGSTLSAARPGAVPQPIDASILVDDDAQLALFLCYEIHFRGLPGVDDREWDPEVLAFRLSLEHLFEAALRREVFVKPVSPAGVPDELRRIDSTSTMPLGRYLQRDASLEQVREFVVHRSAYHLKEADPHTFALPRVTGPAKAAFAEIQYDEYGGGRPDRMHSVLFADLIRHLDLDDGYGSYLDVIPGSTLATVNLMSMFGLHRRWRGAAVGHLALFELGSSQPNRLYGDAMRRLGFGADATDFFDEHVEADAGHAMIATYELAGRLASDQPELAEGIIFGAEGARPHRRRGGRSSAVFLESRHDQPSRHSARLSGLWVLPGGAADVPHSQWGISEAYPVVGAGRERRTV